jgi:hypothetical protein
MGTFLVIYQAAYPELNEPRAGTILDYLGVLWTRVVVPNLFGLWVPPGQVSRGMWLAAAATHVALLALVVASLRSRRTAWKAWAFFALAFLPNAVIVGATRIGFFPPEAIAYGLRFNVEAGFLFVIALGAAYLPRPERDRSRHPGLVLAAVGVAGCLALSWWSGFRLSRPEAWTGAQSRIWLDRVTTGLDDLRRDGIEFALVDGVVPEYVAPELMAPYNATSEVVPLIDDDVSFDDRGGGLFTIAADGTIRPVQFMAEEGWDGVAGFRSGAIRVFGAVPREGPEGLCVTPGEDPAAILVDPPPSLGDAAHLRLDYGATNPVKITLDARALQVTPDGPDEGPGEVRTVNLPAATRHASVIDLHAPRVGTVVIILTTRSELCFQRVEVGRLTP